MPINTIPIKQADNTAKLVREWDSLDMKNKVMMRLWDVQLSLTSHKKKHLLSKVFNSNWECEAVLDLLIEMDLAVVILTIYLQINVDKYVIIYVYMYLTPSLKYYKTCLT